MKYKYWTISLIVIAAASTTLAADADSKRKTDEPALDAGQIVSMQAKEFTLPDTIAMVKIPAGKFVMGSPADEIGRGEDETQRTVTISKPFYMAKEEIGKRQYIPLMRPDYKPVYEGKGPWGHSLPELHQHGSWEYPSRVHLTDRMDAVQWTSAVEFCKKLTAREKAAGRLPNGYEYRLPTEAEWEYACRAGTAGPFNDEKVEKTVDEIGKIGDRIQTGKAGHRDRIANKGGVPNKFGLEDMHMGVLEWVLDDYAPYQGSEATDPAVFTDGKYKVVRGGFDKFNEDPGPNNRYYADPKKWRRYVRSASRGWLLPGLPYPHVGIRPVLAPVIEVPEPTIPEEYDIGVLEAEEGTVRKSDLAEFEKVMDKK